MGRLCWPTKHPATDPGTRRRRDYKVVPVRGGHGALFAVRVQVLWALRVSGYKVDRGQDPSQGTLRFIAGTGAVAVQAITKLSR